MDTCTYVVQAFESVDKILWRDYSNEISSVVVLHGALCFLVIYKMKFVLLLQL